MGGAAGVPAGALLAVHAHPDDETLATGALLATWAAAGRPVTVVTCTRGERGEVVDTPSHPTGLAHLEGDGPALAAHRETELAAALAALGVADHAFLDALPEPSGERYEDSGMAWVAPGIAGPAPDSGPTAFSRVPLDEAAARLAAVVRDRRPAVVATYERGGGYGHPDHVRTHEVTVRALDLAADPVAPLPGEPWSADLWQAVAPAHELRAAREELAGSPTARALAGRAGLTFPLPDGALPPVARDAGELDGRTADVATGPVLDRLLEAMRAHATQVQHARALPPAEAGARGAGVVGCYALSNGVLAPVLAHESYLTSTPVGSRR